MHDTVARLFKNHYEAQVRSLASFCKADLLALTMESGAVGVCGGGWGLWREAILRKDKKKKKREKRKKVEDAKMPCCMIGERDVLIKKMPRQ